MGVIKITENTDNAGGILNAWLVPASSVATFLLTGNQLTFALNESGNWLQLPFLEDSSGFTVNRKKEFNGLSFESRVRVQIGNRRDEVDDSLEDDHYLALVLDGNGNYTLFGSKEIPLVLEIDSSSGNQPTDLNQYTFSLAGIATHRPIIVDESLLVS